MRNDFHRVWKRIVPERVVAVVVGVDEIEQRLVREFSNSRLNLPGHRAIDAGVNDNRSTRADYYAAIVARHAARHQSVNAPTEKSGKQFHSARIEIWSFVKRWAFLNFHLFTRAEFLFVGRVFR